jgi:hypothetical protein
LIIFELRREEFLLLRASRLLVPRTRTRSAICSWSFDIARFVSMENVTCSYFHMMAGLPQTRYKDWKEIQKKEKKRRRGSVTPAVARAAR